MKKPSVKTKCVASQYEAKNEKIIEFGFNGIGGLISFTAREDGTLLVDIYQIDKKVTIRLPRPEGIRQ